MAHSTKTDHHVTLAPGIRDHSIIIRTEQPQSAWKETDVWSTVHVLVTARDCTQGEEPSGVADASNPAKDTLDRKHDQLPWLRIQTNDLKHLQCLTMLSPRDLRSQMFQCSLNPFSPLATLAIPIHPHLPTQDI